MGGKRPVKKEEKVEEPKPVNKPRIRKSNISTTPDLLVRKPIGERKYETKQSLNLIESTEFKDEKPAPLSR